MKQLFKTCGALAVGAVLGSAAMLLVAQQEPPVYMVVSGTLVDPEGLAAYGEKAGPLAREAGLEILARGPVRVFEGQWEHPQILTIERFDSMADLENFWNSEGYQEAIKLREGKFVADFIVAVEGQP